MYLKTENLFIKDLKTRDFINVYFRLIKDEKSSKFMDWQVKSIWQSFKFCKFCAKHGGFYSIRLHNNHKFIGWCGGQRQDGIIDKDDCGDKIVYDIGIALTSKCCGKGYGKEAVSYLSDYLLNNKADIITSYCNKLNIASARMLEKSGFKFFKEVSKYNINKNYFETCSFYVKTKL